MFRKRRDVRFLPTVMIFLLAACLPAAAQESPVSLSLAQCMDTALAEGADNRILQRNLDIAREQHRLAVSQTSYSLSASLGESATYGFGETALLSANSLASGFNQLPSAGLAFATPLTSVGLSTNPYIASNSLSSLYLPGPMGSLGISVSQTIWNGYPGGTARATVDKSLLSLRGRELATASGRLSLTSAVTQAYFVALGAQHNLAVKKEILDQQKALLSQINAIHDLRQATDVDMRSAQINAQSAEIDVQSAENDLRIARIRLAQLMGWSRDKELSVAEEADPAIPVARVDEAVADALKRRTDLQQIDLNRQSSAIDRTLIKGQRTPSVSVSGGVTMFVGWDQLGTAGQGSLGVKIGMPILDSGAAEHQLDANSLQNEVITTQESQLRASIATDAEEAFDLMQIQLQRLQIAKLNAEKFDILFTLKKTEAQYGTATNQDLLTASVDSANARSALTAAQRNAQLAVLQLRNAMGY
jgi:outer membrane protein TolC